MDTVKIDKTFNISLFLFLVSIVLTISDYMSSGKILLFYGFPDTFREYLFSDFYEISNYSILNFDQQLNSYTWPNTLIVQAINYLFSEWSLFVILVIFILMLVKYIKFELSDSFYKSSITFKLLLIFIVPISFAFQRGNLILLYLAMLFFLIMHSSKSKGKSVTYFTLILILLKPIIVIPILVLKRSAIKVFPILVGALLITGCLFVFLKISLFRVVLYNFDFSEQISPHHFISQNGVNYISFFSLFPKLLNFDSNLIDLYILSSFPTYIFSLFAIPFTLFLLKSKILPTWFIYTFIVGLLLVFLPPISYYYCVLYLIPAFVLWCKSPSLSPFLTKVESLLFAILFNSMSWFRPDSSYWTISSVIVPFSLLLLISISFYYVTHHSRQKVNSKNFIQNINNFK